MMTTIPNRKNALDLVGWLLCFSGRHFANRVLFLVYPENCRTYHGPHAADCLESIWNNSNCVQQGFLYPNKLKPSERAELVVKDIR